MASTTGGSTAHHRWEKLVTIWPGTIWLALFVLIPSVMIAVVSVATRHEGGAIGGPFGLQNYIHFFTDASKWQILGRSVWLGFWASVITVAMGYPLAFYIARHKYKQFLLLLVIIPFFTSFLIRVYAWKFLLQDNGVFNSVFTTFHLPTAQLHPSMFAIYLTSVYTYLPFLVLPLYAAVERIEWNLLEAAADLGAPPVKAFMTAIFPQTIPGLFAGFLLTFIPAVGTFVISDLMGNNLITLIGNEIQDNFKILRDYPYGSAVSMILMSMVLLGLWIFAKTQGEKGLDNLV